jgi:predicted dithiol-disulfide oxidoreductase (DUF899 family)
MHKNIETKMKTPPIVSPQQWEAARQQLLANEKEFTRSRDALAAKRRRMPWQAVKKNYTFDGPNGSETLLDLFAGRRQLILYRLLRARRLRLARPRLPRLLPRRRSDLQPLPSERPRHHTRLRVARPAD